MTFETFEQRNEERLLDEHFDNFNNFFTKLNIFDNLLNFDTFFDNFDNFNFVLII